MVRWTIWLMLCLGCSKEARPNWYVVESGSKDFAAGTRLNRTPAGVTVLFDKGGKLRLWNIPVQWSGDEGVVVLKAGKFSSMHAIKWRRGSGEVILDGKALRVRAADGKEAKLARADLARLKKRTRGVCDKAAQCCKDAMVAVGESCDVAEEIGDPPRIPWCEAFLEGVPKIFADKATSMPVSCK